MKGLWTNNMKKILMAGILIAIAIASIGLVTAENRFGQVNGIGECNNFCDGEGYGSGNRICDVEENGNCNDNCIKNGESNIICDGQCNGEQNIYQYGKGKCYRNSNSNRCC
jgi:hypothetical protein